MKHWTQYLPEGRRIYRDEVSRIASAEEEIKKMKWALAMAEAMLVSEEFDLRRAVQTQYSTEEIDQAYREYLYDKDNLLTP